MHMPDVFDDIAVLSDELKAMKDECDKVVGMLWSVAALLREADVARPLPQRRRLSQVQPARSNRIWRLLEDRSKARNRL